MSGQQQPPLLGDAPIEAQYRRDMNAIMATLDKIFNGDYRLVISVPTFTTMVGVCASAGGAGGAAGGSI